MSEFLVVVAAAFGAQLLALPGEKGQLVVGGLATRYEPLPVVAGAATAFGAWTAVEIALGTVLQGSLPEAALDAVTAGLFVLFAAWLGYAALGRGEADDEGERPVTDGGTAFDVHDTALAAALPDRLAGFVPAFALTGFGEFGDKTQLVTVSLAVQYGAHPGIWVGEMLAIVPVSLATAVVFDRTARRFDRRAFYALAAVVFLVFAFDIAAAHLLGVTVLPV